MWGDIIIVDKAVALALSSIKFAFVCSAVQCRAW
jgi:hypothetical protein